LYSTSGSANADTLIWTLDPPEAGILEPTNNEVTITWSGTYSGLAMLSCGGLNDCGNGDLSEDLEILISDIPNPEISGSDLVCTGHEEEYATEDNTGSTYVWNVTSGEIIAGSGTHMITILWGDPGAGYMSVTETNASGCEHQTEDFEVTIDECTGMENIGISKKLSYHLDHQSLTINSPKNIKEVLVFDIMGNKIISKTNLDKNHVQINLNNYRNGLYIIVVNGNTFTETMKLIK